MVESTVTGILKTLDQWASERRPIDAQTWMDASLKINSLLQGEVEMLIDLRSELAKVKAMYLNEGKTVAYANAQIEATPEWVIYEKQKALIERAKETILLSKKNATLTSELMRNSLA